MVGRYLEGGNWGIFPGTDMTFTKKVMKIIKKKTQSRKPVGSEIRIQYVLNMNPRMLGLQKPAC